LLPEGAPTFLRVGPVPGAGLCVFWQKPELPLGRVWPHRVLFPAVYSSLGLVGVAWPLFWPRPALGLGGPRRTSPCYGSVQGPLDLRGEPSVALRHSIPTWGFPGRGLGRAGVLGWVERGSYLGSEM